MTDDQSDCAERIVPESRAPSGAPIINGTRISVERILDRLSVDPDPEALVADYSELTVDDVKAALASARDQLREARTRAEAARDRRFRRALAVARRIARKHPHVDGDALLEELEREDAARRARSRA